MNLDIRDPGLSLVDKQFRAKTKPCRSNFGGVCSFDIKHLVLTWNSRREENLLIR